MSASGAATAAAPTVTRTRRLAQTAATRIMLVALGATASIVLAHALGPAGRGAYYIVTTVATTAYSIGHLSLDQAQVTLWTHTANRRGLTANSGWLGLGVGILAAVAAAVIVAGLGQGIVPVPGYGILALGLASVPASTTVLYASQMLILKARIEVVNRSLLAGAVTQCGPLVILGLAGQLSVAWVVICWSAASFLTLALMLPALRAPGRSRDLPLARRTLGIGLRYHPGTATNFLLLRVDIFILNGLAPTSAAVGLYSLAVTLAELTRLLSDSTVQVMLPEQVESGQGRAISVTAATVRMSALLSGGSVGAMCLAAPVLIPAVYGADFGGSVGALLALAPGLMALAAARPIAMYLLRLRRPLTISGIAVVGLTANVGLNLALIPRLGIVGCSAASSVAYAAVAGLQTGWFVRSTGTPLRALIPGPDEVRRLRSRAGQLAPGRRGS